jgi:hypothetical protein
MKRLFTQESGFDGAQCMIRKVLSAGHYNTSSVDLLEQKSKLKKKKTQYTYVNQKFSPRIKHRTFLNVSPDGAVMEPVMVETNACTAY